MPRKTSTIEDTWPLGAYIKEQRGKMSIREAARRADISESRWRQIEHGYQQLAGNVRVPVHTRPETLAAMCQAISADIRKALELAGYDPRHFVRLIEDQALPTETSRAWFTSLPREEREQVLAELQRLHVDVEVQRTKNRRPAV